MIWTRNFWATRCKWKISKQQTPINTDKTSNFIFRLKLLARLSAWRIPTIWRWQILGLNCLTALPKFIRRQTRHYSHAMRPPKPLHSHTKIPIHSNPPPKLIKPPACPQASIFDQKDWQSVEYEGTRRQITTFLENLDIKPDLLWD